MDLTPLAGSTETLGLLAPSTETLAPIVQGTETLSPTVEITRTTQYLWPGQVYPGAKYPGVSGTIVGYALGALGEATDTLTPLEEE